MLAEQEACTIGEAVGAFRRIQDFQGAIDDLLNSGFDRSKLSLLASVAAKKKLRQNYYNISGLAGDPTVRRAVYHSTEAIGVLEGGLIGALYSAAVAATGAVVLGSTLATAIATTAIGAAAGGLIGAILMGRRSERLSKQGMLASDLFGEGRDPGGRARLRRLRAPPRDTTRGSAPKFPTAADCRGRRCRG